MHKCLLNISKNLVVLFVPDFYFKGEINYFIQAGPSIQVINRRFRRRIFEEDKKWLK